MSKKIELPKLPYDYNALEPVISAEIMELHHTKHHQAYVNNYNVALEKYEEASLKNDVAKMISLQGALKFNGGGHVNHSIFWTILTNPKNSGKPEGELAKAIDTTFGSFDAFVETFNKKTAAIQGSGWGWLGMNPETKKIQIATCQNQDPLSTQGLIPILGIDVWEHAFYLQYKNAKPEYLKQVWKAMNWKEIEKRFQIARA